MAAVIVTAVTVLDGVPFGFEDVVSNRRQAPTPERYFPELIDEVDSANIIHNIRFDSVTISPYETAIA